MSRRRAVFLDRDGTIVVDTGFLADPAHVQLMPGAAEAIARLNAAAVPVVIVSNQSGIGRGLFSRDEFDRVQSRLAELLAEHGAHIDAVYLCPHAPGPPQCDCRKPGTRLFHDASAEHDLDLAASWYVGDRSRDVEPGVVLGGHAALIQAPSTPADELARARQRGIVWSSLGSVVDAVLSAS